mmetsp:Transcript_7361/g.19030  ORF Transcript_7361/g.19030 Transcript_7361/m.19030 type:complete len:559 (+) Transcript_7361:1-1677(+)
MPLAPCARAPAQPRRYRVLCSSSSSSSAPGWNPFQFVRTVLFFNKPQMRNPFDSLTSQTESAPATGGTMGKRRALVAGATGGMGKRITEQLVKQGWDVRCLVRDVPKAKEMLGENVDIVAADITQPRTVQPAYFDDVDAAFICTAVKVAPKEGDTEGRSKYYQGIAFFEPEVAESTPEAVELRGAETLVNELRRVLPPSDGVVLVEPSTGSTLGGALTQWGPIDDVVMGGVSESTLVVEPGAGESGEPAAVFRGVVREENNGGFCAVRSTNAEPPVNLSRCDGLAIRLKGNGQRLKVTLRTDTGWDGVQWCASFDTPDGEWFTARIPFSEFRPVFRAQIVKDRGQVDASRVTSVQLMLSKFEYDEGDGRGLQKNPTFRAGPFAIPIAGIRGYVAAPRLVYVSSAGVTRWNRPGINVDEEPPAVKMNDMLGGILTYKLAAEEVVRNSGLPFAIVRPCALTEEPPGAPLEVSQGDVIRGKISRDDAAELCVGLLSTPEAKETTFELKCTLPFSEPWTGEPAESRDWASLLKDVKPWVTGRTVDDGKTYTGTTPERDASPW